MLLLPAWTISTGQNGSSLLDLTPPSKYYRRNQDSWNQMMFSRRLLPSVGGLMQTVASVSCSSLTVWHYCLVFHYCKQSKLQGSMCVQRCFSAYFGFNKLLLIYCYCWVAVVFLLDQRKWSSSNFWYFPENFSWQFIFFFLLFQTILSREVCCVGKSQ